MKVSFKGSQNGINAERKLIIDKYYLYGLDQVKRLILGLGLKRHMKGLPWKGLMNLSMFLFLKHISLVGIQQIYSTITLQLIFSIVVNYMIPQIQMYVSSEILF